MNDLCTNCKNHDICKFIENAEKLSTIVNELMSDGTALNGPLDISISCRKKYTHDMYAWNQRRTSNE